MRRAKEPIATEPVVEDLTVVHVKPALKSRRRRHPLVRHLRRNWQLYAMLAVPILYYIIFKYIPMTGNIIAFRKYRSGSSIFGDEWSGLKYFKQFIVSKTFLRALRNTLTLNISYLMVRFPMTLMFALLLNEFRVLRWKKFVQTVSYLPHFIAVVIVAGMVQELLLSSGPINQLLNSFGIDDIHFLGEAKWFPMIFVTSGVWQGLGWGTILYLAAMSHINPNLYEAASVDGAGHFRSVLSVTIPCIMPTITTLLILDIGGLVSSYASFEKVFLLSTSLIYEKSDIISTFVYRMAFQSKNFSYATAVGLFEGVINLFLLTVANKLSKKITGSGLW